MTIASEYLRAQSRRDGFLFRPAPRREYGRLEGGDVAHAIRIPLQRLYLVNRDGVLHVKPPAQLNEG